LIKVFTNICSEIPTWTSELDLSLEIKLIVLAKINCILLNARKLSKLTSGLGNVDKPKLKKTLQSNFD